MRRLAMALAALAALALGAPLSAYAQDKPAEITKDQRDKGMKEAPAAVQKAGLTCTVADAYYVGKSTGADASDIYEVACQQGLGYVVLSGKQAKAYDCLATAGQKLACRLPGNADPKQALKPLIASAGVTCTPTAARYIGANATVSVYEVACQDGPGYVLQAPAAGSATAATVALPCFQASGNMACTLTPKAQTDAYLASLAAKSGRTCQVSGSRYIGTDKTTAGSYYELGCGAQPGFVLALNKSGGVDRAISCDQAQGLGGCQLTSAAQVAAESTGRYTQLAQAAGFNCNVSRDRPIGTDKMGRDIVEIACSNRPDGAVLAAASAAGGRSEVVDCVKAGQFGANGACTLTQPTAIYARYTAALTAKGRSTCQVSGARYLGHNTSGTDEIETACADGKPGYVVQITPAYQVTEVLSCGQAKAAGMTCTLPTNARG